MWRARGHFRILGGASPGLPFLLLLLALLRSGMEGHPLPRSQSLKKQFSHQAQYLNSTSCSYLKDYKKLQGLENFNFKKTEFDFLKKIHLLPEPQMLLELHEILSDFKARLPRILSWPKDSPRFFVQLEALIQIAQSLLHLHHRQPKDSRDKPVPEAGTLPTFQLKVEGCQLLLDFHTFVKTLAKELRHWREEEAANTSNPHRLRRTGT